jgi:integrase
MSKALRNILLRRVRPCNEEQLWLFPNEQGSQLSKNTIDKIMPRLCKKAKVKPFGLHSIRHHVAAQLAMKWPLIHVQKFLRHKRATTTDIYLRSITNIKKVDASILDEIEQKSVFRDDR